MKLFLNINTAIRNNGLKRALLLNSILSPYPFPKHDAT